ncbi:AAA-domain-containing protein [Piedraia hortae CBS 480.64]|uniref:AAA-domain-containing protein n=1 Tax=Piedraia hortae CBS 480.64 TaxID=1314780 RepID=A0A6A7C056_9PEZI|nr:AAA-domain-containing protein [Piedraia hortae CBS 480.64]
MEATLRRERGNYDPSSDEKSTKTSAPGENFFSPKYAPQKASEPVASSSQSRESTKAWLLLEGEAILRAGLETANLPFQTKFAASRVDTLIQFLDFGSLRAIDETVNDMAGLIGADIVRLDANDISEFAESYLGETTDGPGSLSALSYEVYKGYGEHADEELIKEEEDFDPEDDELWVDPRDLRRSGSPQFGMPGMFGITITRKPTTIRLSKRDHLQLDSMFGSLLDAARQRSSDKARGTRRHSVSSHALRAQIRGLLVEHLKQASDVVKLERHIVGRGELRSVETPKTIVHVRDIKKICDARYGRNVIRRLVMEVQRRRSRLEQTLVVGTSSKEDSNFHLTHDSPDLGVGLRFATVPSILDPTKQANFEYSLPQSELEVMENNPFGRILEINLRHITSMLRRLVQGYDGDLLSEAARKQMTIPGTRILSERVLSMDQIQRLVLIAVGLKLTYLKSAHIAPLHIGLAALTMTQNNAILRSYVENKYERTSGEEHSQNEKKTQSRIESVKKNCNSHERRLLTGVKDEKKIKTGFDGVHVHPETIEALKTVTSLSLQRPEAFTYGILAADRLSGLLMYGPPGTGKTLLAKAVAKESKAIVLEISGAHIYEKYVGEGEKMVRAVFSLAKRLSPCVVFIDEADAIFGSRQDAGNRTTHREIINQFLREWDGMDNHGVFIMVATNRPFDLDDAVLRRLPRRLLIDLPTAKDREAILRIHLKDEIVDESVNLTKIAEEAHYYSGSDLKNMCVSAALACVREENEMLSANIDAKPPEIRILKATHFDKAMQEIGASVSADMHSLAAIRKFDEQYGDRKGKRKVSSFGFGDPKVDENSVRVRHPYSIAI